MDLKTIAYCAALNSALYLTGCFIAGIITNDHIAWKLALAATGITFIAYATALNGHDRTAGGASLASIALGVAAGVALLV